MWREFYAGAIDTTPETSHPQDAYAALAAEEDAVLVDVRTTAEWNYVGLPDLSALGKRVVCVEWQRYPDGAVNGDFVEQLQDAGLPDGAPIYFLCRSGVRSVAAAEAATRAGLGPSYNVARGLRGSARRARPPGRLGLEERRTALAAGMSEPTPGCARVEQRLRPDTIAVRGGLARSNFDETAEALYLTSGFVYESAEQAEAAFKDEVDHFIYRRYGNPTVTMFEERLRAAGGGRGLLRHGVGDVGGLRRAGRAAGPG